MIILIIILLVIPKLHLYIYNSDNYFILHIYNFGTIIKRRFANSFLLFPAKDLHLSFRWRKIKREDEVISCSGS